MDINKVWLSGKVITQPTLQKLGKSTPIASFLLQINEHFKNKHREERVHENIVRIESLGSVAEKVADTVKKGGRYMVDGYLRYDAIGSKEDIRVRTFAVYSDQTFENKHYLAGLTEAFSILENSLDIDAAKEKIAELLRNA